MLNQCPFVVWIDDILGQISEIKTINQNKADILGMYLFYLSIIVWTEK